MAIHSNVSAIRNGLVGQPGNAEMQKQKNPSSLEKKWGKKGSAIGILLRSKERSFVRCSLSANFKEIYHP